MRRTPTRFRIDSSQTGSWFFGLLLVITLGMILHGLSSAFAGQELALAEATRAASNFGGVVGL